MTSFLRLLVSLLLTVTLTTGISRADTSITNVSYDLSRSFYTEYNPLYQKHAEPAFGKVDVAQSHKGSSAQAAAVAEGAPADVVTMNQETDIDFLADKGLIAKDWRKRLPNDSSPFSSTTVILVRKGNPKGIKDWDDLAKPGVAPVICNPKTSGNGRYSFLSAYAYGLKKFAGDEAKSTELVGKIFKNAPLLAAGGRAATQAFVTQQTGDALVTFENEVLQITREGTKGDFEIVYPSVSVAAPAPVSVVDTNVDKNKTRPVSEDYLKFLWTEEAQKLAAKHYLRPVDAKVLAASAELFPKIEVVTVDEKFGGWTKAQKTFFADGGVYDVIFKK